MHPSPLYALLSSNIDADDKSTRKEIKSALSHVLDGIIHDTHKISDLINAINANMGLIFGRLYPQKISRLVILPCSVVVQNNIEIFKSCFKELILIDNFKAGKLCRNIKIISQDMFNYRSTEDIDAFFLATSNQNILNAFSAGIPKEKVILYSQVAKEVILNLKISPASEQMADREKLAIVRGDDPDTMKKKISVFINYLILDKAIEANVNRGTPAGNLFIDQAVFRSSMGEYKMAQQSIENALSSCGKESWRLMKQVVFFLTYRCNYHCVHCWNHKYIKKSIFRSKEMRLSDIVSIFERSAILKKVNLLFTGGEIFIREDIIDLLTAVSALGISFTILTNGSYPEKIELILADNRIKKQIRSINFSLDGDRSMHDAIRAPGAFDKLCHSLEITQTHGMPFSVGTVIQEKNYQDLERVSAIAKALKIPELEFNLEMKGRKYVKLSPINHVAPFLEKDASILKNVDQETLSGIGCFAGITKCNIRPDGVVESCATATSLLTPFILGELKKHDWHFGALLESDQAADVRSRIKTCPGCASFCER